MSDYLNTNDLINRLDELHETKQAFDALTEELHELTEELHADNPESDDDSYFERIGCSDDCQEDNSETLERIAEIESELDTLYFDEDEYNDLIEMESQVTDWQYGVRLINEYIFVDYIREYLEDVGELKLPDYVAVDWEETADNMRCDYTEIEYQGETYLYS